MWALPAAHHRLQELRISTWFWKLHHCSRSTREAAQEILLRWRSTWWALGKRQTSRAQLEREEPPSPCSSKTSTSTIKLHWRDMRTAVMSPGLLKP